MPSKEEILKQYWGFDNFRPLQASIIDCVLQNKDCIALLPTGAGKSICYQLPALCLGGLCIVVSPLISLMQDQVSQLNRRGIQATYLHAGLGYKATEEILHACKLGDYALLYVSPERLSNRQFQDWASILPIRLLAIDEAHCIAQWGHQFRPEYLNIKAFKAYIDTQCPIIALTASATQKVIEEISEQLELNTPELFQQSFERKNIFYKIYQNDNKIQQLLSQIKSLEGTGIIYCRSRSLTEHICKLIQEEGYNAVAYHAGLNKEQRSLAQQYWIEQHTCIMVATTAFGMGIDKADVRFVIHFDAPETLEAFYQESGRAGRDSKPAQSILLYGEEDIEKLQNSTALQFPDDAYLRKVYQAVCDYLQLPIGVEPNEYYPFELNRFFKLFKLEAYKTSYALKLLAQEGLWTISDAVFHPARVNIQCSRSTIDDLQIRYPFLGKVANSLLRLYANILHQEHVIHVFDIARFLNIPNKSVVKALLELQQLGVLQYKEALEGQFLHFHHERVAAEHLLINHKKIRLLKNNHEARIQKVINYLNNTSACRTKLLLNYFDQAFEIENCGHCDVCIRPKNNNNTYTSEALKSMLLQYLQTVEKATLNNISTTCNINEDTALATLRRLIDEGSVQWDHQHFFRIR